MLLDTFNILKETPEIEFNVSELANNVPGLFLATSKEVMGHMPHLEGLLATFPRANINDWLFDVKVHMLMKGQYPCIPNWHCDFVPRIDGKLQYDQATLDHSMLLWLSTTPTTQFLKNPITGDIRTHEDIGRYVDPDNVVSAPARTWIGMGQRTPHRGAVTTENTWRVFVRAVHKDFAPKRNPSVGVKRFHTQVYLDATTFTW